MLADQLSRTLDYNCYKLHHSTLGKSKLQFDFDLFGSPLHSLAPAYCTSLVYRARRLRDCPALPRLCVAVPPWHQVMPLLSEAVGAPENVRGKKILLIVPHWPAQPWWPLLLRVAKGRLITFGAKPWVSPAGHRP